ncbi:MAG: TrkH family potassium uptake protein, partial [Bacteroidales bacterium]|nr:TrkH family potassium uptake protein [Bacteroidales bacterium]
MNIRFILYVLGALLMIEGGLMLFPALVSLIYGESDLLAFLLSSLITVVTGGAFWLFGKGASREINSREGYIIVSTVLVLFAFV